MASLRDLLEHPSPPRRSSTASCRPPRRRPSPPRSTSGICRPGTTGRSARSARLSRRQDIASSGPPGGIYANELFADERGEATVFVPVERRGPTGRPGSAVRRRRRPSWPTITHAGSHADVDRSYGALATYVTEHALAVDGPDPRVLPGRPPRHRRRVRRGGPRSAGRSSTPPRARRSTRLPPEVPGPQPSSPAAPGRCDPRAAARLPPDGHGIERLAPGP